MPFNFYKLRQVSINSEVVVAVVLLFMNLIFSAYANWGAGVGKTDITGEYLDQSMMGYGKPKIKTTGIHTHLFSRAFCFEEEERNKRAVFVIVDLGMISGRLREAIIESLSQLEGNFPGPENILISATHTHAAPGGYFGHKLYNISSGGFKKKRLWQLAEDIAQSISLACNSIQPAKLYWAEGNVEDATINKSRAPYLDNFEATTSSFDRNVLMSLLRIDTRDGQPLGMINWFAIHPTSMGNKSTLISGDNKGVAALKFEQKISPHFVAGFANSNEGDVLWDVSNQSGGADLSNIERTEISGQIQMENAWKIYQDLSRPLSGPIQGKLSWVKMPGLEVEGGKLCRAGLGYSFANGSEGGLSEIKGFFEGMKQGEEFNFPKIFGFEKSFLSRLLHLHPKKVDQECHFPKPVLFATGRKDNWSPDTLPFQILRLGPIALLGVPGEMTTIAGQRLKENTIRSFRDNEIKTVVISGLSNEYAGYISTPEEYQHQHYEGASTHFGPLTLQGHIESFQRIAETMEIPQ